ncbi:MAG TPA: SET domain-containing protein-lysine N-methyltransferase [Candidatus Limnocylindria bacterium]|nr:SET domain-containing protein-lysine N-methyltransferase [Candidatus Limnocylindria bacterium]
MDSTNEFSFVLKPSTVPGAGVGIFAVHDIAEGTKVTALFSDGFVTSRRKVSEIPKIFLDYCIARDNDEYDCPRQFNRMEIGWYLNHSATPNLRIDTDAHYTTRDIKAGEEVLINYNELDEPEDRKQAYYKDQRDIHQSFSIVQFVIKLSSRDSHPANFQICKILIC